MLRRTLAVTRVTWLSSRRGVLLSVLAQNDSQSHRVGREHGAAEVDASQAFGGPPRAPRGIPWAAPRGVPFSALAPRSHHDVHDALLVQVAALCVSKGKTQEEV